MKVIFCQGLPASGKSTWAREYVAHHPDTVRVNRDDIRDMVHNGVWSKEREQSTIAVRDALILQALRSGKNVIVDDTNFGGTIDRIKGMIAGAEDIHPLPEYETKVFDCYLHEALARNNQRTGRAKVPNHVIKDMHRRYIMGSNQKRHYRPFDPSLPCCILIDVDGTLALQHESRSPYQHELSHLDNPHEPIVRLVNDIRQRGTLAPNNQIVVPQSFIFSARDGSNYDKTVDWLKQHGILFDAVYMREAGDTREDTIVKREMFEEHIDGKYNVLLVFDDREQVVRLWRSIGLPTLAVNYGDF